MYSEPEWSHATTKPSFLEVLKEGKIIGNIPIPQGTKFYTFGRLPENNVPLDHESTSRNHAVLQFGPRNAAFIYDLGSSHGTFVNKKQISPGQYVKIISGNAIIRFGASSRQYILNLEEYTDEEISPDSHECNDYRSIISSLFSEHVISLDRIECTQIRNITSCSLDFSEFISIDSSEPSRITSTGASKEEALDNFFEDSYNFFSRLGLISQRRNDNCSEYETDSDDSNENFYTVDDTNPKNSKPSNAPLSENEILNSRNQAKSKIESIQSELEASLKHLHELEREVVDDFDVYIQDLKKSECKKDIEKLEYMLDKAQKELSKYQKILQALGFKETYEEVILDDELVRKSEEAALDGELRSGDTTELKLSDYSESNSNRNAQHSKLSNSVPKKMKYEIEVNKNSPNTEEEEETEADFEDSTIHDKHMDLNVLKRKYGY